ncbi:MAG: YdcF family protein [Bacteroidota bacterium]
MEKAKGFLKKVFKFAAIGSGMFFILAIGLSFTPVPFYWHRWLGEVKTDQPKDDPEVILMLGGGGMPSESNLMRLYYVVEASVYYPKTKIVIAHPADDSTGVKMVKFLEQMGVDNQRISLMHQGHNTREQLMSFDKQFIGRNECFMLITSAEHMRRSVMAAKRLGMDQVMPLPAFETAMFINLDYDFKKAGGMRYAPDVSNSNSLRYDFWNYLKLEIICVRETVAICYYWINDWV